jgi:hypothetical protein
MEVLNAARLGVRVAEFRSGVITTGLGVTRFRRNTSSAYRFAGQPICSVLGNQMLIS